MLLNRRHAIAASAAALALPSTAFAQSKWPERPVTFVVPYAAGGGADIVARELAQLMTPLLGQSIIVDNKGGAAGGIGTSAVANARPDGHTLLYAVSTNIVLNPYVLKGYKTNTLEDLIPIVQTTDYQYVLAVHPDVPAKTLKEFVDLAKAKPGSINFASASTSQLVSTEMLAGMAGIQLTNVPYKSGPAAMTDLIGGVVQMFSADFAVMLPQVKAGKVRGLAVTSSKRSPAVPELPTVNEALGLKDYELIAYFAIFAPAGTPADVVNKLNKAANDAANSKEVQDKFAGIGFAVEPGSPADLARRSVTETAKWAKAIRDAKIEPQ